MRVALIGANWGLSHLAAWRSVPGVEIVGVCTAHRESAERVAREHNLSKAFWDAERMLATETIDVVDVMLRPSARVPLVLSALRQRTNVLQPLPFARNIGEAQTLLDLATAGNLLANVEALHRYSPAFLQAKALIDGGFLGTIYTIEAAVRSGILIDLPPGYVYEWITKAENGSSAIRNFGAHMLHALLWLFGDITHVAAANATMQRDLRFVDGSTQPNETADTSLALLRYASGAIGSLHATWSTPAPDGFTINVAGSEGRLVLRADRLGPQDAHLFTAARSGAHLTEVPIERRYTELADLLGADPRKGRDYPLAAMCYRYAEAFRSGDVRGSGPTFADAYRVAEIVESAYCADRAGAWVEAASAKGGS